MTQVDRDRLVALRKVAGKAITQKKMERLVRMGKWGLPVSVMVGDRGVESKGARRRLAEKGIENRIAPKDPKLFAESWKGGEVSAVASSNCVEGGRDGGADRDFQE